MAGTLGGMAYGDVEFGYREVASSADLNQLAENTKVANEFIQARTALPHSRVRHTAGNGVTGGAWRDVSLNTTPADGGPSLPPGTIDTTGVTITTTGLYLFTLVTSMNSYDFGARLLDVTPTTDVVIFQGKVATTGNALSDTLSGARRLTAGAKLVWQVYKNTDGAMVADAATTPCYLDIIRLSD